MCDRVLASVESAAAALDLSESTIRRMIAAGQLPSYPIRGKWRIPWSALRAFDRQTDTPQPGAPDAN